MAVKALATLLSLNRVGFALAFLLAPERAARGWVGRGARRPATAVMTRGFGARDFALGAGALQALARGADSEARVWMAGQAAGDASDLAATLVARRRLPDSGVRFLPVRAGGWPAVGLICPPLLRPRSAP